MTIAVINSGGTPSSNVLPILGAESTTASVAVVGEGSPGRSAYRIAVENGFSGTEVEWLQSLIGNSAYEVALNEGFVGTKQEWLESLHGESAYELALNAGFVGTEQEWIDSISLYIEAGDAGKFLTNDGTAKIWKTLVKDDVGLSNVDNTSDLNKPISTATQAALDEKLNTLDLESEIHNQSITIDQGDIA